MTIGARLRGASLALMSGFSVLYGPSLSAADPVQVVIEKFEFRPAALTIKKGTTVSFVNRDAAEHTATAADLAWTSKNLKPGESYQRIFAQVGQLPYICGLHPFMKGTLNVTE